MTKKPGLGSLLLAGAAAYGVYRLMKMSSTERDELLSKGKKLVTDNLGGIKEVLGSNGRTHASPSSTYGGDSYQ